MNYPKCKKCQNDMSIVETELKGVEFDGVSRIYQCEKCCFMCEAEYNFEHITPTNLFWEDEQE